MNTAAAGTPTEPHRQLLGQTVVIIGGSAGIGLETARAVRAHGAEVILTARSSERLKQAASELGALGSASFDATDIDALQQFFAGLAQPIDHVMLSGSGPYYAPLAETDFDEVTRDIDRHLVLPVRIGLHAVGKVRPGGSLLFIGVNLVAPGFVDTPLSASLLGDQLDARRDELQETLPIGRVVGPADVAALAVHLMTNTALTGATYDVDGGQQLV